MNKRQRKKNMRVTLWGLGEMGWVKIKTQCLPLSIIHPKPRRYYKISGLPPFTRTSAKRERVGFVDGWSSVETLPELQSISIDFEPMMPMEYTEEVLKP